MRLAYSLWKRGAPISTAKELYISYYSYFLSLGIPFVSVSYEDFATAPLETTRRLYEIVGLKEHSFANGFPGAFERHHLFGSPSLDFGRSDGGTIRAMESYPDEFRREFESHDKAKDTEIYDLSEILKSMDVNTVLRESIAEDMSFCRRPRWYYKRRLWLAYRRFFPLNEPQ